MCVCESQAPPQSIHPPANHQLNQTNPTINSFGRLARCQLVLPRGDALLPAAIKAFETAIARGRPLPVVPPPHALGAHDDGDGGGEEDEDEESSEGEGGRGGEGDEASDEGGGDEEEVAWFTAELEHDQEGAEEGGGGGAEGSPRRAQVDSHREVEMGESDSDSSGSGTEDEDEEDEFGHGHGGYIPPAPRAAPRVVLQPAGAAFRDAELRVAFEGETGHGSGPSQEFFSLVCRCVLGRIHVC